jgi:hypothetical protein
MEPTKSKGVTLMNAHHVFGHRIVALGAELLALVGVTVAAAVMVTIGLGR